MNRLSQHDLDSRRLFDWRTVHRMNDGCTYTFSAHRTPLDAQTGNDPITNEAGARHAIHYRAEYRLKTLVGPGQYATLTILRIDASAACYPFEQPAAWVVETGESRTPWSPHFSRGLPVCVGRVWRPDGKVLLAHFVLHLARLLNWHENLSPGYAGYNRQATEWWRRNVNGPLDPELRYPALPVDLLYDKPPVKAAEGFRPLDHSQPTVPGDGFQVRAPRRLLIQPGPCASFQEGS